MNTNKITILFVEDNEDIRDFVGNKLKKSGYSVSAAENGFIALNILKAGFAPTVLPDVIVTDLEMPVMCGREFVRKLKDDEDLNLIPVILFSSHPDAKILAEELGFDAHLPKFADISAVEETISNLLKPH